MTVYFVILYFVFSLHVAIFAEDPAVSRFREYLQINTAPPNPEYESALRWIRNQAMENGLEYSRIDFPRPQLFVARLTWRGSNPDLKTILLNSHIDVVPSEADKWTYPPFGAVKDSNGNIYGRGSLDRKSLGALYLEAIRKLKEKGFVPVRTVHITFVPDEELGGFRGMMPFTESYEFKKLNIGFALDEGPFGEASYAERSLWQFNITAKGQPHHAATMLADSESAGVKLIHVINDLFKFRKTQMSQLTDGNKTTSDVTSINLSIIGGGVQANIVPSEVWAVFDMRLRLRPDWQYSEAENMLKKICDEAGPDVSINFIRQDTIAEETKLDENNSFWMTMKSVHDKRGLALRPAVLAASSDARFLRKAGVPTVGYSTIQLKDGNGGLHSHNENINEQSYLDGIDLFEEILRQLSQVASDY